MIHLDKDGQPVILAFNWHRNLKKSIESLLGICHGIIADNQLNDSEILFLDTWLKENVEIAQSWPGDIVAARVQQILADGIVTADEADDLKKTLAQIVGGATEDIGAVSGMATRLPIDNIDNLKFSDSLFCFTGKFIYGSRRKCETTAIERGARVADSVTRELDYLVIGTLASRDWAHTSHGRKIEHAVTLREKGASILIVAEEAWVNFL